MPEHEIHNRSLETEQIAQRSHHDLADPMLAARERQRLFHDMREVLKDDNRFGARVAYLVTEFTGGIERVDVHDREARPKDAKRANRVLEAIGQHDGDPCARLEALGLEPGRPVSRESIE